MSQILVPSALLVPSLLPESGWADWIMQSGCEVQSGFCCVICLATKQAAHLCQSRGLSNMKTSRPQVGTFQLEHFSCYVIRKPLLYIYAPNVTYCS